MKQFFRYLQVGIYPRNRKARASLTSRRNGCWTYTTDNFKLLHPELRQLRLSILLQPPPSSDHTCFWLRAPSGMYQISKGSRTRFDHVIGKLLSVHWPYINFRLRRYIHLRCCSWGPALVMDPHTSIRFIDFVCGSVLRRRDAVSH